MSAPRIHVPSGLPVLMVLTHFNANVQRDDKVIYVNNLLKLQTNAAAPTRAIYLYIHMSGRSSAMHVRV